MFTSHVTIFMVLLLTLAIIYIQTANGRMIDHQDQSNQALSQNAHDDSDVDLIPNEDHQDTDQHPYYFKKRKSDFLLSLYGLPFGLVNQGESH